jgi:predicted permease
VLAPAARGFSYLTDQLKKPLLILFIIVALVLFIACANVANLMLARGAARQREIAVRLAVGASRLRVISQLLTESMLIALLGGISGIAVAFIGIRVLLQFMPHVGYELTTIKATLDWRALGFTLTACALTGLLFGIAPAWQSTRPDLVPALKDDLPGSTGAGRFTLRKGLVISQVALSLPLLVGASLFARTLGNLRDIDTGFSPENVFIVSVDPTSIGYKGQRILDFYNRLCARVGSLPGVRSASLALITPLTGSSWDGSVTVEGYAFKPGERNSIFFNAVGPRYFEALGTPLLLGREFTDLDNPATAIEIPDHPTPGMKLPDPPGRHVAIVNETFVHHFFGDRSALGMHVSLSGPFRTSSPYEIVGIVKDARYVTMRDAAEPMMFVPIWRRFAAQTDLLVRTSGPVPQLSLELRREVHKLDPVIPILNIRLMKHDVDESILAERLIATLSGFFGVLALMLSAIGLYGVVAYSVTRRTREIGIRIALGADRNAVLWLILKDGLLMIVIGAGIGAFAAFISTRAIAGMLFGVRANDPISIMATGFCLVAAAIVASFLPARRAARIEPSTALRYD